MAENAVILLVEDQEEDILLIRRAFKKASFLNPLQIARDGEEAMAYLEGIGKYRNRDEYPLPSLVLLDLKIPRVNGFEVLKWIRGQPSLSALRVVVLTASQCIQDVNLAYQLGANSFLVKPVELDNFVSVVNALQGYWLWLDKAPEVNRPRLNPGKQLLRDRRTGLFLSKDGDWTADESYAVAFNTLSEVMHASEQHQVESGDVLIKFGGDLYGVFLPLCQREANASPDS